MRNEYRPLPIYEVRTPDGGVGIQIGEDGAVHMGYDARDLMRLLSEVFPDHGNATEGEDAPEDAELLDVARQWLDPDAAADRRRRLARW